MYTEVHAWITSLCVSQLKWWKKSKKRLSISTHIAAKSQSVININTYCCKITISYQYQHILLQNHNQLSISTHIAAKSQSVININTYCCKITISRLNKIGPVTVTKCTHTKRNIKICSLRLAEKWLNNRTCWWHHWRSLRFTLLKVGLSTSKKFTLFASVKALKNWWKMLFISS